MIIAMGEQTNKSTASAEHHAAKNNNISREEETVSRENEDESHKPYSPPLVPPDGGWGWAIVFGNCLVTFVNSSIMYCFGIVYVYLVQSGYSNAVVAIIPAIMNGLSNLLAPLSTGLSRFYSNRRLTIIGILLISVGLLLCTFSNHVIWFYICYGVILGIGNSLVQPQGFLLSQQYFHKRRVTANGLSMTGQSLGFMVIPLLINYFIHEYAYPGAFMLWSGIVLHGIIGASLFQPVKWHMKPQTSIPLQDIRVHQTENQQVHGMSATRDSSVNNDEDDDDDSYNSESEVCSRESGQSRESPSNVQNTKHPNSRKRTITSEHSESDDGDTFEERRETMKEIKERTRMISFISTSSEVFAADGMGNHMSVDNKQGITNGKSMDSSPEKQETRAMDHFLLCGITFPRLKNMINFKLIKHPAFLVSSSSSVANRIVYMCFVTYLPAIANDIGVGNKAPYLYSCIAIFEFLAKILMSLISDRGWIERRYYLILSSFASTFAVGSITFATDFWGLVFSCCLYGLCVGTTMSVGPVLLVEYLGVKLLSYSFGLLLFMNGIAGVLMLISTGLLNDLAGNYIVTYWVLSALVLIPGVLWCLINCFLKGYTSDAEAILYA